MTSENVQLTPTVITDKNGKVTTVHKKNAPVSKATKRMPAPVISPPAFSSSLERLVSLASQKASKDGPRDIQALTRLHTALAGEAGEINIKEQMLVAAMDNAQTEVIANALETHEGFLTTLRSLYGRFSVGQIAGYAAIYEDDLFISPDMKHLTLEERGFMNSDRFSEAYPRLRRHKLLGEDAAVYGDLSKLDETDRRTVSAYFRLHGAIADIGQSNRPSPDALLQFALHSDYETKDVAAVIRDIRSTDISIIMGVLEGIEAPVAEGWL